MTVKSVRLHSKDRILPWAGERLAVASFLAPDQAGRHARRDRKVWHYVVALALWVLVHLPDGAAQAECDADT